MKRITLSVFLFVWVALSTAAAQEGSRSPHGSLRTQIDCTACHSTGAWKPMRSDAEFNHGKQTGFALAGKHASTSCGSCHNGLRYDKPRARVNECASCHVDVHKGRLGASCSSCHNTESFARASSTGVHARTTFPLTGAHAQVPCASCHRNEREGEYTRLETSCASCHRADYEAARTPSHSAASFSVTCQQCHSTARWTAARFNHATVARGFALLGAHVRATCGACHTPDGKVLFTASGQNDCVACHRADYDRKHANTSVPTTCASCHYVEHWTGATMTHARFPLTGVHALQCASCHAPDNRLIFNPVPATPNDCVACHRADYDRHHAGSGFPTLCTTCHSASSWTGARLDHDGQFFPIYSGKHRGKWTSCAQCHPSASNYVVFSCASCHTQAKTDPKHTNVRNYAFDSVRCLACHPKGD